VVDKLPKMIAATLKKNLKPGMKVQLNSVTKTLVYVTIYTLKYSVVTISFFFPNFNCNSNLK